MLTLTDVCEILEGMDIPCPLDCAAKKLADDLDMESVELVDFETKLSKRLGATVPKGTLKLSDTLGDVLTRVNACATGNRQGPSLASVKGALP
jgi:hypothetical protein